VVWNGIPETTVVVWGQFPNFSFGTLRRPRPGWEPVLAPGGLGTRNWLRGRIGTLSGQEPGVKGELGDRTGWLGVPITQRTSQFQNFPRGPLLGNLPGERGETILGVRLLVLARVLSNNFLNRWGAFGVPKERWVQASKGPLPW